MITTDAWVLHRSTTRTRGALQLESVSFPAPRADEVLVEPLYGCWEANMSHALARLPIDVCEARGEDRVVLGNAGVVRVVDADPHVHGIHPGDLCLVFCSGLADAHGFPAKIFAYDAPGTIGVLARQTTLRIDQLIRIPEGSRHSLPQWAAFSLRYVTAWANWKVAHACWRAFGTDEQESAASVWGWGGGVTFAELQLARMAGFPTTMICSGAQRRRLLEDTGIAAVDRGQFSNLCYHPDRYATDAAYRELYQQAERSFLALVMERTAGRGVSIFAEFIGLPVFRATLKALGRPGIVTTAGWKHGMQVSSLRAMECMNWHTHVHTHYGRRGEAIEAVRFAEDRGWIPPIEDVQYGWEDVPQLAADYAAGRVAGYFPVFRIASP